MFNVGQKVEVIDDKNCNLFRYDVHTVEDVRHGFVKINGKLYANWRFQAVTVANPVNNTLEDRVISEVTVAIEDRIESEGLESQCDADDDVVVATLAELAYNLGFQVEINMEPKVSVTKR
jgi:hypothetical protein